MIGIKIGKDRKATGLQERDRKGSTMTYQEAFEALCKIADENGIDGAVSLDIERCRTGKHSVKTEVFAYCDQEVFSGFSFESVLSQVKDYAAKGPLTELDEVVL